MIEKMHLTMKTVQLKINLKMEMHLMIEKMHIAKKGSMELIN